MQNLGVFDEEYGARLVEMSKFRNRLVHLYWEIDKEMVYDFIQNNLDDFRLFQEKVIVFLNKNKLEE